MTQRPHPVRKTFLFSLLIMSLTGCAGYHQKQCAVYISVEADHAKDLDSLVVPGVENGLKSLGYENHLNNQWVKLPKGDLIKTQKESQNPFVVDILFWDDPGSYTSCNTKSAFLKSELERHLQLERIPAKVYEMIPND